MSSKSAQEQSLRVGTFRCLMRLRFGNEEVLEWPFFVTFQAPEVTGDDPRLEVLLNAAYQRFLNAEVKGPDGAPL